MVLEEKRKILNKKDAGLDYGKLALDDSRSDRKLPSESQQIDIARNIYKLPNINIEDYRIGIIPSMFYISEFISISDEQYLLNSIDKAGNMDGVWQILRTRKLQCWGGDPPTYIGDNSHIEPLPPWLQSFTDHLVTSHIFPPSVTPNHVLVNRYEDDEGILHHTDGPSYVGRVAILSMNAITTMTFRPHLRSSDIGVVSGADVCSVVLEPRSLLVFTHSVYEHYMHGIYAQEVDVVGEEAPCVNAHLAGVQEGQQIRRGRRTSLTVRRRATSIPPPPPAANTAAGQII